MNTPYKEMDDSIDNTAETPHRTVNESVALGIRDYTGEDKVQRTGEPRCSNYKNRNEEVRSWQAA